MTDYASARPKDVRALIRAGQITAPTTGMCDGYAQGNLIVLPKEDAYDFLLFAMRNPKPCPILEVSEVGDRFFHTSSTDCDIANDFPRYRVYHDGVMVDDPTSVEDLWRDDLVAFLIGCSFSFESELIEAGIEMRHNPQGRNVSMYITNIACEPAGKMSGNMVVSMRPIPHALVPAAVAITAQMPRVHGMPVQIGDPSVIGIDDISKPDFGDAVDIHEGEVPVFWPCGVTPQSVVMNVKPKFAITHAPGCMLITDTKNISLKF